MVETATSVTTPTLTEAQKSARVAEFKRRMTGLGGSSWGFATNANHTRSGMGHGCFGSMPGTYFDPGEHMELGVLGAGLTTLSRYPEHRIMILEWADYIINRSPFADAFLDKDPEGVMTEGSQVDINLPGNYLICAVQELRKLANNSPEKYLATWQATKRAVGEVAAHYIMSMAQKYGDYFTPNSYGGTWRSPLSKINFTNFINNKKVGFTHMRSLKDHISYSSQWSVWYTERQQKEWAAISRYGQFPNGYKHKFDFRPDLHGPANYKDSFGIDRSLSFTVITCPIEEWAAKLVEANYLGTEWNNE